MKHRPHTQSMITNLKHKLISILLIVLLFAPVSALSTWSVSYIDSGFQIGAYIIADVPWVSPLDEDVDITITMSPDSLNVTEFNVTEIILFVSERESDTANFDNLLTITHRLSPVVTGNDQLDTSIAIRVTGSASGVECYFGLVVRGGFANDTGSYLFTATSGEDLAGPFTISLGIGSPLLLMGLALGALFAVVLALGAIGVKRSRRPVKRQSLLEE